MFRIIKELIAIVVSAVAAMLIPFLLIQYNVITKINFAYALMFWIYAHSYLIIKTYFIDVRIKPTLEFEVICIGLTLYMVLMQPYMYDKPTYIQLPACYGTFLFISVYLSVRGPRHWKNSEKFRARDVQA